MTAQKNRNPGGGRAASNEFRDENTVVGSQPLHDASGDDLDTTAVTFDERLERDDAGTALDLAPVPQRSAPPRPLRAQPPKPPAPAPPRPAPPSQRPPMNPRAAYASTLPDETAAVPVTAPGIIAPGPSDFDDDVRTRQFEAPPPSAPEPRAVTGVSRAAAAGVGTGPRPMTARHGAVGAPRAKGTKDDPFALIGTVLERRFRVERLVAEGGYGSVYYATHLTLERAVALKVLKTPPGLEGEARREFMDKFVAEAKVIARLNHPNIVQILDTDVSVMPTGEPAPWMALEWLEGRTLETLMRERRGQRYAPHEAVRLLRPVLEALAFAHSRGIAHRDVKPSNIVFISEGAYAMPKLLDFGIAKVMQPNEEAATSVTRNASVNYSPHYASPEQVAGMRSGPWSDVHAVGLLLTELLTGRPAYAGGDLSELMSAALNPSRPTPRVLGVDVGSMELVIEKSMAFKSTDRYQHMREVLNALDAVIPPKESSGPFSLERFQLANPGMQAPTGSFPSAPPPAGFSVQPPTGAMPVVPAGPYTGSVPVVGAPQPFGVAGVAPAEGVSPHGPTTMLPAGRPARPSAPSKMWIAAWIAAGLGVVVLSAAAAALVLR